MCRPAAIPILLALAAPAAADTVYLKNGRSFEEVIAEASGDSVRIRLPYGEIVLPAKSVARVERMPSTWQQYLERERELRSTAAPAGEWLELARWSERHGFERGMRTAALVAARLEPAVAGLEPYMTAMGYSFDAEAGQWLTEGERMRRRGYVAWRGRWVTPEVRQGELRLQEQREAQRREEQRQERITRAIEALAVAQLSRAQDEEPEPEPRRRPPATGGSPLTAVFPGYFPFLVANPHAVQRNAVAVAPADSGTATFEDLVDRQPGSLFPGAPRRRHLTASDAPRPRTPG